MHALRLAGLGLLVGSLLALAQPAGSWQNVDGGLIAQSDPLADPASTSVPLSGEGGWRCVVEPGPYGGTIAVAADGLTVELFEGEGGTCRLLADGKELWRDAGVGWVTYEPLWVEAVQEPNRVRAQLLAGDTVVAMSPWLPWSSGRAADQTLRLTTQATTARFALWSRSAQPLAEYTPDNPSALRVPQAGDTAWQMLGGGSWRWRTAAKRELQQNRKVERTTLFRTARPAAEGTWRCRIRLDKGTCGGGMLVHATPEPKTGFLVWCGGTYGDGALMLYRWDGACAWSSPQGQWKWNTEYMLEATIADGAIRARLLAADGTSEIAASKPVALLPDEVGRRGMIGYQTWRGTGSFWPEGETTGEQPAAAVTDLGEGWQAAGGQWKLADGTLAGTADQTPAQARCTTVQGARGVFRCRAVSHGATGLSLLFQQAPDGTAGFACQLNQQGLKLNDASGKTLWSSDAVRLAQEVPYRLEGVVDTDRVRIRLLDDTGKVLAESVERYVSDTNNERVGQLGVSCTGGRATFTDWSWTAP